MNSCFWNANSPDFSGKLPIFGVEKVSRPIFLESLVSPNFFMNNVLLWQQKFVKAKVNKFKSDLRTCYLLNLLLNISCWSVVVYISAIQFCKYWIWHCFLEYKKLIGIFKIASDNHLDGIINKSIRYFAWTITSWKILCHVISSIL